MNNLNIDAVPASEVQQNFFSGLKSPLLAERIKSLAIISLENKPIDRVGELLPQMLNEIAEIDPENFKKIGAAWYGIYLYSMIMDQKMDLQGKLSADDSMASAYMLNRCINDVRDLIPDQNTKHEFVALLEDSIVGQLEDYAAGKDFNSSKADTSIKKNAYLMALAVAFSSIAKKDNNVVGFTRNIVLAIQYLDDVTDYLEDYRQGNHSVLLQKAFGLKSEKPINLDEVELLCALVNSGALEEILIQTTNSIEAAFMALSDKSTNFKHYCSKLSLIRFDIKSVVEEIRKMASSQNPVIYVPSLKERLTKIAFSS
jgi:hypothetical protein